MQRIRLGGFLFYAPQRWKDITPKKLDQLSATKPNEIRKRVHILCDLPEIKLSAEVYLAIYEICSFIEEIPELVPNRLEVTDTLKWISEDWTFAEFETARAITAEHLDELGIVLYHLAKIKELEKHYLEAGAKALDGMKLFLEQWSMFDLEGDKQGPTDMEELAGIDRLQAFGVYPILETIAAKFGKLPSEIEKEPVGWVMQEYIYQNERNRYSDNLRKLQAK